MNLYEFSESSLVDDDFESYKSSITPDPIIIEPDLNTEYEKPVNVYDEIRKKNILLQLNGYNELMRQSNGLTLSDKIINDTANTYCTIIELMSNNKKKILRNQHKNAVLGAVLYYTMKNYGIIIDIEFLKKFMKCDKITNGINDLNTFCETTGYDITNGIEPPTDIILFINTCKFHLKLDDSHAPIIDKIRYAMEYITRNSISDNSNEKSLVSALYCMMYPHLRDEIYKNMIIKQTTIDKIINEYKKYPELMEMINCKL